MNRIEKIKIKGLRNARDVATLSNGNINIKCLLICINTNKTRCKTVCM